MPNSVDQDLPNSYVVIDARTKKYYVPDRPFAMVGAIAIDLPHDLWRDFEFFLGSATDAELRGDAEMRYRFLRAGLLALFAHLNAMFDMLIASRKDDRGFQDYSRQHVADLRRRADAPKCEHGVFVQLFTGYATDVLRMPLPVLDFSVKPLRNALAHPKDRQGVTVADLYDLEVGRLAEAARSFRAWLVSACAVCQVELVMKTDEISESFVAKVSGTSPKKAQEF